MQIWGATGCCWYCWTRAAKATCWYGTRYAGVLVRITAISFVPLFLFLPYATKGFFTTLEVLRELWILPIFIVFSVLSPMITKSEKPEDVLHTILSRYGPCKLPMNYLPTLVQATKVVLWLRALSTFEHTPWRFPHTFALNISIACGLVPYQCCTDNAWGMLQPFLSRCGCGYPLAACTNPMMLHLAWMTIPGTKHISAVSIPKTLVISIALSISLMAFTFFSTSLVVGPKASYSEVSLGLTKASYWSSISITEVLRTGRGILLDAPTGIWTRVLL